jgi:hypothetical protein
MKFHDLTKNTLKYQNKGCRQNWNYQKIQAK